MWELAACSVKPYEGMSCGDVLSKVVAGGHRPPFSRHVPQEYADLARRCWAADPAERPDFGTIATALAVSAVLCWGCVLRCT